MAGQKHRETLLCLLSGGLTALAMPGLGLFPLIFVSMVPFFYVLERSRGFLPGVVFGVAFFAIDLRWMITLLRFYPIVVAGYAALAIIYAATIGLIGSVATWRDRGSLWTWLALLPGLFVLAEFARAQGPLAYGFSTLYSSLYRTPALIQSAAFLGPWFLTGVIVAVNAGVFLTLRHRRVRFAWIPFGLVLFLACFAWLPRPDAMPGRLQIAVIASEVEQEKKLDARNLSSLQDRYLDLGRQALDCRPDLIVFPESILPAFILQNRHLTDAFAALARVGDADILLGTGEWRDGKVYNLVALISPSEQLTGTYAMVRPVPFGETIPGRGLLERVGLGDWIRRFLPMDLTPGQSYTPIAPWGTPICYEITFPGPARSFVRNGAQALITVANDAWFDGSSAVHAHFASTVFRAVETRRWVVQSANGGISGIVNSGGRIIAARQSEGVLCGDLALVETTSLYTRLGDAGLMGLVGGWVLLVLVRRVVRFKRSRGKRPSPAP